jgi:hypothetical protein
MPGALVGQRVEVRAISLEGETVYVAAVGRATNDECITRSITGVRRILGYPQLTARQLLVN